MQKKSFKKQLHKKCKYEYKCGIKNPRLVDMP